MFFNKLNKLNDFFNLQHKKTAKKAVVYVFVRLLKMIGHANAARCG